MILKVNLEQQKNVKIAKSAHAVKGFANSYVKILKSFNPELQLQAITSAVKSKLID